jgi:hypothetical protein
VVPSDPQPALVTGLHWSPEVVPPPPPPPPALTLLPPTPAVAPRRGPYPTGSPTTKHATGAVITTVTTATNFQEAFAIIVVAPVAAGSEDKIPCYDHVRLFPVGTPPNSTIATGELAAGPAYCARGTVL